MTRAVLKLFLAILLVLNGIGGMPASATARASADGALPAHCHAAASKAVAHTHRSEHTPAPSKHPCGCCHHNACLCGCSVPADIAMIEWRPFEQIDPLRDAVVTAPDVPTQPPGTLLRPPIA